MSNTRDVKHRRKSSSKPGSKSMSFNLSPSLKRKSLAPQPGRSSVDETDHPYTGYETDGEIKTRLGNKSKFWEACDVIQESMELWNNDMEKYLKVFGRVPDSNADGSGLNLHMKRIGQFRNFVKKKKMETIGDLIKIELSMRLNTTLSEKQLGILSDCIKNTSQKQLSQDRQYIFVTINEEMSPSSVSSKVNSSREPYYVYQIYIIINTKNQNVDELRNKCSKALNLKGGQTSNFFIQMKSEIAQKIPNLQINIPIPNTEKEPSIDKQSSSDLCEDFGFAMAQITGIQLKLHQTLKKLSRNKFGEMLETLKKEREKFERKDEAKFVIYQKNYFKLKNDDTIDPEFSEAKYLEQSAVLEMKRYEFEMRSKKLYDRREYFLMQDLHSSITAYWEYFRKTFDVFHKLMTQSMPIMKAHINFKEITIESSAKRRRNFLKKGIAMNYTCQKELLDEFSSRHVKSHTGIQSLDQHVSRSSHPGDEFSEGTLFIPHPSWCPVRCKLSDGNFTIFYQDDRPKKVFNVLLITVKESRESKFRFAFVIIDHTGDKVVLQAPGSEQMNHWMTAIRDANEKRIGNHKVPKEIEELWKIDGNSICADCRNEGTEWCSINLGIFLCTNCSGPHRALGVQISKVRSLTLDNLAPEIIEIMKKIGNVRANAIMESNLPDQERKLKPTSGRSIRSEFIKQKYLHRNFVKDINLPQDEKNNALFAACKQTDCVDILRTLFQSGEVNAVDSTDGGKSPLHMAVQTGDPICVEFLLLNDADILKQDDDRWIPLHHAASADRGDLLKKLLKQKSDAQINICDKNGRTPLDVTMAGNSDNLPKINDAVLVGAAGPEQQGAILRYIGEVEGKRGQWAGVELNNASGYCDGTYNGKKYFDAKPDHGLFARVGMVMPDEGNFKFSASMMLLQFAQQDYMNRQNRNRNERKVIREHSTGRSPGSNFSRFFTRSPKKPNSQEISNGKRSSKKKHYATTTTTTITITATTTTTTTTTTT